MIIPSLLIKLFSTSRIKRISNISSHDISIYNITFFERDIVIRVAYKNIQLLVNSICASHYNNNNKIDNLRLLVTILI